MNYLNKTLLENKKRLIPIDEPKIESRKEVGLQLRRITGLGRDKCNKLLKEFMEENDEFEFLMLLDKIEDSIGRHQMKEFITRKIHDMN